MGKYRRILALVPADADGTAVAQRAVQLSRYYGATLALATVVETTAAPRSNLVSLRAAAELRQAHLRNIRSKLERMMTESGCDGGCEIIIGSGRAHEVVAELTRSWRPDLVLVDSRAHHGLEQNGEQTAYDLLTVQFSRPGFSHRMINALASSL
jgi:nucleotide-binding universal stress UspA family protein